jgi:hypothetical protein
MSKKTRVWVWVVGTLLTVGSIATWAATRTAELGCDPCCCGCCPFC